MAQSLADRVTVARMQFSTLMLEPGCTPSLLGACEAANSETGIWLRKESRPWLNASKVRNRVMILVIEAG